MKQNLCRFGILGTAAIAKKLWKAIAVAENATVVAVASRHGARAEKFIQECEAQVPAGDTPVLAIESYDDLIRHPDVDVVYIPLPTAMRKSLVIAAAQAGKHVLCEKPAAIHADDLKEMIDACEAAGVQFIDGVMFDHNDRWKTLLTRLATEKPLGKLRRIQTHFSFPADESFRQSNIRVHSDLEPHGCLGDLGWYCLRFSLGIAGGRMPESVSARTITPMQGKDSPGQVPGEFSAELQFANGLSAGFYCSFQSSNQQTAVISGDLGYLTIDDFVLPFAEDRTGLSIHRHELSIDGCCWDFHRVSEERSFQESSCGEPTAQEVNMVTRMADISHRGVIDPSWHQLSLKTQQILDACRRSDIAGGVVIPLETS